MLDGLFVISKLYFSYAEKKADSFIDLLLFVWASVMFQDETRCEIESGNYYKPSHLYLRELITRVALWIKWARD